MPARCIAVNLLIWHMYLKNRIFSFWGDTPFCDMESGGFTIVEGMGIKTKRAGCHETTGLLSVRRNGYFTLPPEESRVGTGEWAGPVPSFAFAAGAWSVMGCSLR